MAHPIRERLTLASQRLKEAGYPDSAADVEAVLAPGGWTMLRAAAGSSPSSSKGASNLSITTGQDIKGALKAAADEIGVTLSAVAEDGFRALVEGRWAPPGVADRVVLPSSQKAGGRTVLNLSIPESLRERVRAMLPTLSAEAGYEVTEPRLALIWTMEELGVEPPAGAQGMKFVIRKSLRDHLVSEADRQSLGLQEVLEGGIRALVDGSWEMPRPQRAASRPEETAAKLTVPVDNDLLVRLHEMAPEISDRMDYRVYPGTIALAILRNRLGEPAE
jgi:hypothetical protein